MIRLVALLTVLGWSAALADVAAADEPADSEAFFEKRIRPVLAGTCFRCHGDKKASGGLRVDSRETLIQGGESGSALVPGNPTESLLVKAIRRDADVSAMPPDSPLAANVVADFLAWIEAGAPWPANARPIVGAAHWAFEPLQEAEPPQVAHEEQVRTAIDRFLLAKLEEGSGRFAPLADRRTILRRLTYTLTGLPPTPEESDAFANDSEPNAVERAIDRLLESPHYGEHWGRHWLDVVRYADTAGENSDHPLPHAWRYRNWVIHAFNADKPYDQFLHEQIAGDLLAKKLPPNDRNGYAKSIEATGFWAISRRFGHDIDKDIHLTYEDALDTLGKSVLGLSIGCCRCHDHKYDPLSASDYYGLYGILQSTTFAFPGCEPQQQPRDLVPLLRPETIDQERRPIETALAKLDGELKSLAEQQAEFAPRIAAAAALPRQLLSEGIVAEGDSVSLGDERTAPLARVAVKKGEMLLLSIGGLENHGADSTLVDWQIAMLDENGRTWNTGSLIADLTVGNPQFADQSQGATWSFFDAREGKLSYLPESSRSVDGRPELHVWRNPNGALPSVFVNRSDAAIKVWTTLPPRSLFVHPSDVGPVAIGWQSPLDGDLSITGRIADAHPGGPNGVSWKIEKAPVELSDALAATGDLRRRSQQLADERRLLAEKLPAMPVAYGVTEGAPQNARLHQRGNPEELGDEVPRKFLSVFGGAMLRDPSRSGREELAHWLTEVSAPLAARVMVNRIWQAHFGQGLVGTPNDFGTRGDPPSHPELLDYLAREFIASGWSVKQMHRLILASHAFGQRSDRVEQDAKSSPADEPYSRFPIRRLSAEALRDTLLALSGDLDRTPGEAHPFPPESSWSFTQHGPFAAEYPTNKRSVYVMQKRNRRIRFFALFDGADPNASTPRRDATTVPTQALFFLNDPFFHDQAAKFARRTMEQAASSADAIALAYRLAIGRAPSVEEAAEAAQFLEEYSATLSSATGNTDVAKQEAWAAFARVLLSGNAALHIE